MANDSSGIEMTLPKVKDGPDCNAIEKRVMVSNNNYEYALRLIKDQSIEIKYD